MQKKNRIKHAKWFCLAGALLTAGFLCGCTRKEELLILTEEAASQEITSNIAAAENGEAKNADLGDALTLLQEEAADTQRAEASAESGLFYVHVCGAVKTPGVYELPAGSRVYEAVQAAGGFAEDAEQNYVNQAQILTDGAKLVIPTVEEAAAANDRVTADDKESDPGTAAGERNGAALQIGIVGEQETQEKKEAKININTASMKELCAIPGVGETRAAAIISYRESHGGFTKPEDIMKVSGIKEGMYEKIKESISVE